MAVFRVHKTKNYTVMANHHLQNTALSLRARGLLSIILSLPDGWNYSKAGLLKIVNESEFVLNNALDELKEHGYLEIEKHKPTDGNNRYTYTYNIFEIPRQDPNFQGLENQGLENYPIYKRRNPSNTNKSITKIASNKTKETGFQETLDAIKNADLIEALNEFIAYRKEIKHPVTAHTLKLLIGKLNKLASTDAERIEILNQSMVNGWQGIFELKRDSNRSSQDARPRGYQEEPKRLGQMIL